MITHETFVAYSLALWATSYILVFEDGPWGLLKKLRSFVGVYYTVATATKASVRQAETMVGKLFNCPICLSVWLCVPMYIVLLYFPWVIYALGGVGLIITLMEFMHSR